MPPDGAPGSNPFPGLRPFRTEEHHLFFGREAQTAALLGLLREHRFLAVVGTSGSGKSSLVRAGLIPALHRGSMARAGTSWEVVVLRPGGHPASSLARALLEAGLYDAEDPDALPRLRATLTRSLYGLTEAVRQSPALDPTTNLLVVVDQFEELFRFRAQGIESEEAAGAFVSLLLAAARAEDRRIFVAITMRSDYLGDCAQVPGLAEAVNRGEYLIPRLTRDQRRDAIEKPVGVSGARIAPRLVQQMLNDVGDDPDQLPVLQHALMRTWDSWVADHSEGEPLELHHYEATGGMGSALSRHADEVFASLPDPSHRAAAERVFKALTVKGADNRGIRRPTRLDRLALIAGATPEVVRGVIDAYRRPGVTFLMPSASADLEPGTVIDLSHESLMRIWRRLNAWVEEEAQSARVYHRLAETAALWQRGEAGLYHDPDLHIARTWREACRPNAAWAEQYGGGYEAALTFLDQSREAAEAEERAREAGFQREIEQAKRLAEAERRRLEVQRRAAKRLRVFAAGLAVVAALAAGAFFFAMAARREAVRNAELAERNEKAAAASAEAASLAAGEAQAAAKELERTLLRSDLEQGVQHIEGGESSEGLPHLARALRTDSRFWPAAVRITSTLSSGRFPLRTFPTLEQERVITTFRWNEKQDLLLTSDATADVEEPQRFVWDVQTGQRLYAVAPGKKMSADLQWTQDGSLLVGYGDESKTLQVWEARTGKEKPPIATAGISSFVLGEHPQEGTLILVLNPDWTLRVFRAQTGEPLGPRLEREAPSTDGCGFTPDGLRVWGAGSDAVVAVWDAVTGARVREISTRPYRALAAEADRVHGEGGVFFSPDGAFVVFRAPDGKHVNWWRVGEESPAAPWLELEDVSDVVFLPGGRKVAFISRLAEGRAAPLRVRVHDLSTRAETARIDSGTRDVGGTAVLMTERPEVLRFPLLAAFAANMVRVWDLETGGLLPQIFAPALLQRVALAPEGRRILTVSTANDVMLWDLFTGAPLLSEPIQHQGRAMCEFSPDGETLVTYDMERRVLQVWDSRTGVRLVEPFDVQSLAAVVFAADGQRLLAYERIETTVGTAFRKQTTGRFLLFDLKLRPELLEPLLGGSGGSALAKFTPEGKEIVALGRPQRGAAWEVLVFDAGTRRLLRSLPLPQGVFGYQDSFQLSGDGRRIVLGCSDDRARVWDTASGELLHELVHERAVLQAAVNADGSRLATGTDQGKVRVWDLETGAPSFEPLAHGDQPLHDLKFSPDGSLLASASRDFKLRLADARTGAARSEPLLLDNVVQMVVFSPDGTHIAAVPFTTDLPIVEAATGAVVRKLRHTDACRVARFSPDGRLLAVATGGNFHVPVGEVTLWSWREGRVLGRPLDTRGSAGHIEFSRDGALLATGTIQPTRGAVRIWDVASGLALTDAAAGRTALRSLGFNPSATELVAAWEDGSIRVIGLPPRDGADAGDLARLAEAVAGRRLVPGSGGAESVPRDELERLRTGADSGWSRWFFDETDDRTISPRSRMTFREYLGRLRRSSVLEELQDALRLAPADGLTHARIGLVLLEQLAERSELDRDKDVDLRLRRHWQETAAWYGVRAVELEPGNPEAWSLQAEIFSRLGRKDEARRTVARAMEIDPARDQPASPNALYLQALSLGEERRWEEADQAFAAALDGLERYTTEDAGVPLLGVLAELAPARAPAGFRAIRLSHPIPGTFEDFESTPEGQVPAGWTARHEPFDAPPAREAHGRLDAPDADVFADWTTLSIDRVLASPSGSPYQRRRLLARGAREPVNGASPRFLLNGRFLLALSAERASSHVQHLFTPEYDCRGRAGVHAIFHSATEQAGPCISSLEYSVDGGKTWLPLEYRLNASHLVNDAAGKLDAVATLRKAKPDAPLFIDEGGRPRGTTYGEFIGAKVSRDLDPFLHGLRPNVMAAGKRVEVFRLERADNEPRVQLRFLHAGRYGWYWAIDDFGLYELPAGAISRAETADRAHDAGLLASKAFGLALGTRTPGAAGAEDESAPGATEDEARQADAVLDLPPPLTRRALDSVLVARRALALAPENPAVIGSAASVAALAGEVAAAQRLFQDLRRFEPLHRSRAFGLLSLHRLQAAALDKSGNERAAAVLFELCHLLVLRTTGKADRPLLDRLAAAGLAARHEVLLERGSQWRYLDDGTDPGPSWVDPGFDDAVWLQGPARLGYGGDGETTKVSFGADARQKHITTYFRAAFEVREPGRFVQLKLSVARDDGVRVFINGEEAVRDNLAAGDIGPRTTASAIVNDEDEKKYFEFDAASALLRPGRNVVAAEVHQQTANSSDLGFDLEIEAIGSIEEPLRDADELEAIEVRLALPDELRSALWAARAERARLRGDLDRAEDAVERAAQHGRDNPGVLYERALLLQARGDGEAAYSAYLEAARSAIALKTGGRSSYTLLLPGSLRSHIEPIIRPSGLAVAAAAGRLARSNSPSREVECGWLLRWSESLDRDGHEARLERAEALLALGKSEDALAATEPAFALGLPLGTTTPRQVRERNEWLNLRERCLRRLGRTAEADLVRGEVFTVRPRDPNLGAKCIDLTQHYNSTLYDGRDWHGDVHLRTLAESFLPRDGIGFDLRGLIQLTSGVYPQTASNLIRGRDFNQVHSRDCPDRVDGIRVGLQARALHFLTACAHGQAARGTEVAHVVIHYEDGSQERCPLIFGEDVVDWANTGEPELAPDRIAWVGGRPLRILYRKTWTNPAPEKLVASFDFVSAKREAAPFLVAATAE